MGSLVDKLLNGNTQSRREDEYYDLDDALGSVTPDRADTTVHFAEVNGQQDVIKAKDAVYDGDMVVIDLKYVASAGLSMDYIVGELRRVADEVGGDIAQRGEDQLVVTPEGVSLSRQKL